MGFSHSIRLDGSSRSAERRIAAALLVAVLLISCPLTVALSASFPLAVATEEAPANPPALAARSLVLVARALVRVFYLGGQEDSLLLVGITIVLANFFCHLSRWGLQGVSSEGHFSSGLHRQDNDFINKEMPQRYCTRSTPTCQDQQRVRFTSLCSLLDLPGMASR